MSWAQGDDIDGGAPRGEGDGQTSTGGGGSSPSACTDAAYSLKSFKAPGTHHYFVNRDTIPTYMSASVVLADIGDAFRAIVNASNDCGLPDNVSAPSASYAGITTRTAEVSSTNSCESWVSRDGYSVIDFGDLQSGTLGWVCTWHSFGRLDEADYRFNRVEYLWTTSPGSGCSGRWDVQSIATHESGHIYGLDHVSESSHANLTMSDKVNGTCQSSERTLGKGDVLGLEAHY